MTNKITKVYKNGVEYDIYASGGAAGTGDVTGPSSSTDADIALFSGATGKIIKDSGKKLSDYQTALSTQTAYTTKGTATKVPTITTNTLGQVTGITETDISFPVTSVNGSTGAVTVQPGITKIFTLSSTSDLTNAQAAYDWYVSGGNPIIRVSPGLSNLYLGTITSTTLKFTRASSYGAESNGFWASVTGYVFTISSGSVTAVTSMDNYIKTSSSAPGSGTSNNTITFVI